MLESSIFFDLLRTDQLLERSANQAHQLALAAHLKKLITSESFVEAQHLIDLMSKVKTSHKRSSVADILPLERETKQWWQLSYANR